MKTNQINPLVDCFSCLLSKQPLPTELKSIVDRIQSEERLAILTAEYRRLIAGQDKEATKDFMLTSIPALAPCGRFLGGKARKDLVSLTGLCLLDLDDLSEEEYDRVLAVVKGDNHTVLASRSISGHGLHVLIHYTLVDKQGQPAIHGSEPKRLSRIYTSVWKTSCQYVRSRIPVFAIEEVALNAERLILIGADPDVYYNPEASPLPVIYRYVRDAKLSRHPAFTIYEP